MIRIEVVSVNGQPPPQPNSANFGVAGGTIGRASTNSLTLPDPSCLVSRVHAQISTVNNRAVITDQSINALSVNNKPLGKGNSVELSPGDRIVVGSYVLEVKAVDGTTAGIPVVSLPAPKPVLDDDDPFADLMKPAPKPVIAGTSTPAVRTNTPTPSMFGDSFAGVLPADFDPLADPMKAPSPKPGPSAARASASPLDDFGIGEPLSPGSSGGSSLDDMFGLTPGASSDPFAGSSLGEPRLGAGDSGTLDDSLAGIMGTAPTPRGRDSVSNHLPEFQGAFTPPRARSETPVPPPSAAPAHAAHAADSFLSWDGAIEATPKSADIPMASPKPAAAPPSAAAKTPPQARPAETPHPAAPSAPAASAPRPAAPNSAGPGSAGDGVLLDALIRGLGIKRPELPQGLTPELMERIGQLLRESTQGTLDLLLARATTKREMRAEVTMIVSRGNNPLKFSPDVNTALTHLISPLGHGFLPPIEALRDAQNDLRAHQFGVMAGMRAAFTSVLQQFSPQRLEGRLSQKSFVDSLLPVNRKAKLWELFHELYGEISQEAEEDFQNLFGREFLKAYETQIKRLAESPASKSPPAGNP